MQAARFGSNADAGGGVGAGAVVVCATTRWRMQMKREKCWSIVGRGIVGSVCCAGSLEGGEKRRIAIGKEM